MKTTGHYLFHEEQDFRQAWIIILIFIGVLAMLTLMGYGLYQQIQLGKPWGDQPMSDGGLIITSIASVIGVSLTALLILNLKLITEVRNDGFYYRFPPLINRMRSIKLSEIEKFEVGKYNPLLEYGGWGIRYRISGGKAYNVRGSQGVSFYLKNGRKVLFGTQNPPELRDALNKMMNQQNN
jgi:hypothetical protein